MTDAVADRATAFLEANRPKDAVRILSAHLASHPNDVDALCVLARTRLVLDEHDAALVAAKAAIAQSPDAEWAWRLSSMAHCGRRDFVAAKEAAQTAVRLRPWTWRTHAQAARVDIARGEVDSTTDTAIVEMLKLAPNESEAHTIAGTVDFTRKHWSAAERRFRAALEISPQDPVAQNNLAAVMLGRGRTGSATSAFSNMLGANPQSALALQNLVTSAYASFRHLHLILWIGLFAGFNAVKVSIGHTPSPATQFFIALVPIVEALVVGGYLIKFRHSSGRHFSFFVANLRHIDRFLVALGVLLSAVLALMIAAPFVPFFVQVILYACILVAMIASVLIQAKAAKSRAEFVEGGHGPSMSTRANRPRSSRPPAWTSRRR